MTPLLIPSIKYFIWGQAQLYGDLERVSTGVPELDRALQGGVPRGSWVAISGEPGTGKSVLCMHYAWSGLRAGEPVIYVTTEAEFRDVIRQARQFRMYLDDYETHYLGGRPPLRKPQLVVIDIFSLLKTAKQLTADVEEIDKSRKYAALEIDVLVAAITEAYEILGLLERGRKSPSKHVRLIIDSLSAFWADKPAMARRYSYQLKIATHRENVTAYLVSQYAMTTKSVDYDEPIAILRRGRVEVVRIGEFVDEFFDNDSEGVRLLKEPIYTLSMNPQNLRVEWKRIKAVSRHKEKRKLLRVRLESGRTISVTPDHSLYALKGYKVVPVRGSEIRVGDLIPTVTHVSLSSGEWSEAFNLAREFWSRKIRNVYVGNLPESLVADERFREAVRREYRVGHDSRYYWRKKRVAPIDVLKQVFGDEVFDILNEGSVYVELAYRGSNSVIVSSPINNAVPMNADLARLLGYLVSDGYVGKGKVVLYFNEREQKYADDALMVLRELFGKVPISVYRKRRMLMIHVFSKILTYFLKNILGVHGKGRERRVPKVVFTAPDWFKINFIKGLYAGDGSFNKSNGSLMYTSCSKLLISGLTLLYLSLGVKGFTIREKRSRFNSDAPNKVCYDLVIHNIRDLNILEAIVDFLDAQLPKRKYHVNAIEKILRDMVIDVVDVLPLRRKVTSHRYTQFGKSKYVTKERLRSRLFEAPRLGKVINEVLITTKPQEEVSGTYGALREKLEFLRNFAYGDVGFLEVKQIEPVDPSSDYVYDLSVEDNENFFAGTG